MKPKTTQKKPRKPIGLPGRVMAFPQVRGKTLEAVEFYTNTEHHSIALRFRDKTELYLDIEPGFTLLADYTDWKTGNSRPIKRWPVVRSQSSRM
ncbi:MAG: hypothetical protein LAP21_25860 [Acidobacteriia bacterium]|nr:hypothetical protein [Terriglobia bacterium]